MFSATRPQYIEAGPARSSAGLTTGPDVLFYVDVVGEGSRVCLDFRPPVTHIPEPMAGAVPGKVLRHAACHLLVT